MEGKTDRDLMRPGYSKTANSFRVHSLYFHSDKISFSTYVLVLIEDCDLFPNMAARHESEEQVQTLLD